MKTKTRSHILHLGCGNEKKLGAIGVDINPLLKPDVVHDLNSFPYPWKSNHFEKVVAENILEHLDNIVRVMEELYRISKNGAVVYVTTGHFSSVDSFTDPTHRHFFTSSTFDYFIPGTPLYKYGYSKSRFKKLRVWVGPEKNLNPLLYLILKIINKNVVFYEKRFAFIFPAGVITYELEVIKNPKRKT